MSSDPARLLAFDVLRAVADRDAYANLELSRLLRERGLVGRDAAFATELVSGTLRMQGTYDAVLDSLADRSLDPPVRDALRLGTHQLLSMRVPPHAAVATTVSLVRARVGHRPAGFVNAVLRKVAADDLGGWTARLAPEPVTDRPGYLAVAYSHPRWVVEALANALGRPGELADLLAADNAPAKVTLVALPGLAEVAELPGRPHAVSPYAVELDAGDPGALPPVREGRVGIQDAGSQLVALALAEAPVEGRDEHWLDICAGPGGKTALLAALAARRDARVLAAERQPHRAALVVAGTRATRAGLAGVVAADGTVPPWTPGTFDRVLVDAPCSGLGALRRRPESRWRRRPEDIAVLVPQQRVLLGAACDAVRPGGVVVYATCSPVAEETSEVVGAVLAGRTGVRLEPLVGPPDSACPRLPGAVQLWPHRHGTDAMFLALLRRRG
ncbi:MAG: rRNA cytosine-C5-methyltransferase [Actinomycetota bacterium]|nr:rRNA cytosine-C5-methyltransferase [Actinomycetota bacterium]